MHFVPFDDKRLNSSAPIREKAEFRRTAHIISRKDDFPCHVFSDRVFSNRSIRLDPAVRR